MCIFYLVWKKRLLYTTIIYLVWENNKKNKDNKIIVKQTVQNKNSIDCKLR